MLIALAGNPNSGKTTLFNNLTRENQKVGNWGGVTVSYKLSKIKKFYDKEEVEIVDLPGAYSISPYTSEETITTDYITKSNPDIIINVVDATNLSRSLFFTTQLLELGIPVIVALNKKDLKEKKGNTINIKSLSNFLNCPVVEITATKNKDKNISELIKKAKSLYLKKQVSIFGSSKVSVTDKERFRHVDEIARTVETKIIHVELESKSDKIDKILAHKWFGLPIFALAMYIVFYLSQTLIGPVIADFLVAQIEVFAEYVRTLIVGSSPILETILVDGIILGVGAVIGFLPLVVVMYFFLSLLEDSGYMARVAVVLDRFFKKVGLSGKSIIPMVIGIGCAIPGIMSSRTIKNERERRTTAMLTPFIPCGAKLPVISLFITAFFPSQPWLTTMMYFLGILLIGIGALLVLRLNGIKNPKNYFIIELPEYKMPSLKYSLVTMYERGKSFVKRAATIILLSNILVLILQTFDLSFNYLAEGDGSNSILAAISTPIAFLFIPLGFGVWQFASAAVTGFIAKENVVGTLAVVFSITNLIDIDSFEVISGSSTISSVFGITSAAALSFLVFILYSPPCFAAIGALRSEMKSSKWLLGALGLQFSFAYIVSFIVYQIGSLLLDKQLGNGFIPGLIVVILIALVYAFKIKKASNLEKALNYA